jgi:MoxR-like ATPase
VTPIEQIQRRHGIVGREAELALSLAVLARGRHLLLEGPVGVGKTTVALAVCSHLGRETVRVDGDDRYSEAKLTGWFDPPLVLRQGYSEESFFAGPLVRAMRAGAVLFINELNRMPESVQNVLLPALDEGLLIVPHIGEVRAAPGFQVIATQNPVEYIATGHLSEALRDRFERVALAYQSAAEEARIVAAETGSGDARLIASAVAVARATRAHPRLKKGASIRAAIALVALAEELAAANAPGDEHERRELLRRAAGVALPTRVELAGDADASLAAVIDEICAAVEADGDEAVASFAAAAAEAREKKD